jgi:hypothetical protein
MAPVSIRQLSAMSPGQTIANKRAGRLRAEGIYARYLADRLAGLRMQPKLLGIVTSRLGRIFLEQLAGSTVQ